MGESQRMATGAFDVHDEAFQEQPENWQSSCSQWLMQDPFWLSWTP